MDGDFETGVAGSNLEIDMDTGTGGERVARASKLCSDDIGDGWAIGVGER